MKRAIALVTLAILVGCNTTPAPTMQSSQPAAAKPPDENAALAVISKINEGQSIYFKLNRRYALDFDELIKAHQLDREPSTADTGYDFKLRPAAEAQTYRLSVVPARSGVASRSFFTDQTGAVRAETGKEAGPDSPALPK